MGKVISIQSMPHRLEGLLENRYAGFAAWEAFRLQDYEEVSGQSISDMESALETPLFCKARELVAMCDYYRGNYASCLANIDAVSSLCATHPICQIFAAESVGRLGNVKLAGELLLDISEANMEDTEVEMFTAGSLDSLGLYHLAKRVAAQACGQDPYCAQYLADFSVYTYRVQGPTESVVGLAWQAICLEPDVMEFRVWLATLYIVTGRYREAYSLIANASQGQIQDLTCICCLDRIGRLYQEAGDELRHGLCLQQIEQLSAKQSSLFFPLNGFSNTDTLDFLNSRIPSTVKNLFEGGQ